MNEDSAPNQVFTEEMSIESLEHTLLNDATESKISTVASKQVSNKKICILDMDSYILNVTSKKVIDTECQSLCSKCDASICSERSSCGTTSSSGNDVSEGKEDDSSKKGNSWKSSFLKFRLQYLLVHMAIMLADGLQGTHLYVLYESYGYSVASLYSLGFVVGAVTSPFIGPVVDKIGRKRSAILYCLLEMFINYLELFPMISGLIISRMIGGITTNLLFSVFESWLVSEHRIRGFHEDKLEIIMRDSTIVSNGAAILSGYLSHCLAESYGNGGPFRGAVGCTFFACMVVMFLWNENFGSVKDTSSELNTWRKNMVHAYRTIKNDSTIARIGIIQGFSQGSLQTFIFLWSPALRKFAQAASSERVGLGSNNEPAYGLIFGAFMTMGVLGGLAEPMVRKRLEKMAKPFQTRDGFCEKDSSDSQHLDPVSISILCSFCYLSCALLLLVPCILSLEHSNSFTICLVSFLVYELIIGIFMPCEGVVRSMHIPNDTICSIMTMLRIVVNVSVAFGVISTNYIPIRSAFALLSILMMISSITQMSLVPGKERKKFFIGIGKSLRFLPTKTKLN